MIESLHFIKLDGLGGLNIINPDLPVFYGDSEYLTGYNEPAFVILPIAARLLDEFIRENAPYTLVAHLKKDTDMLIKKGIPEVKVDTSTNAVLKSIGERVGNLSRASMGIANLKATSAQVQAATAIALLGENKANVHYVLRQYVEVANFAIQEAFLQCDPKTCIRLLGGVKPSDCVGVAALLLSGHSLAFTLESGRGRDLTDLGVNSFYANKVRDLSTRYVRKVSFDRVATLLAFFLDNVKRGLEPTHLLRRTVLEALS